MTLFCISLCIAIVSLVYLLKSLLFTKVEKWKAYHEQPVFLRPGKYDVVVFGYISKADRKKLLINLSEAVSGSVIKTAPLVLSYSSASKFRIFYRIAGFELLQDTNVLLRISELETVAIKRKRLPMLNFLLHGKNVQDIYVSIAPSVDFVRLAFAFLLFAGCLVAAAIIARANGI